MTQHKMRGPGLENWINSLFATFAKIICETMPPMVMPSPSVKQKSRRRQAEDTIVITTLALH
jgi:hypothetical protein